MVAAKDEIVHQNQQIGYLNQVFQKQKREFRANPMPSSQERIALIKRIRDQLLKHNDMLCSAVSDDFGNRCPSETKIAEIMSCIEGANYVAKKVPTWMKPSKRRPGLNAMPASAKVVYQPMGVVGIIVPWNYPIFLAISPMLHALAAGNRVIIKMSEFTPKTAEAIKTLLTEAYDEDQVAVITGDAEVGEAFSKMPWDHLLFTGSTSVGRHVMRAAADNLTPVTLELGGKSPAIISDTVPMKDAAERIAFGKCINAGQTCVAPDYVLCPEHRVEEFKSAFTRCVATMYPTPGKGEDFTNIINERQLNRLKELLADAKAKGAQIEEINPSKESFEGLQKLPVTLVSKVNEDMTIMQDEIFGPLLLVIPYRTLNEALEFVADRPRPLALYYFDYDQTNCEYVLANSHSGGVCLNDTISHVVIDDMPFGGVGASGMGHYHGHEGFLTFSKAKSVLSKGKFNSAKLIFPPWNRPAHKLLFKTFLGQKK